MSCGWQAFLGCVYHGLCVLVAVFYYTVRRLGSCSIGPMLMVLTAPCPAVTNERNVLKQYTSAQSNSPISGHPIFGLRADIREFSGSVLVECTVSGEDNPNFPRGILLKVCAVYCIEHPGAAKAGSQGVWSDSLCKDWVGRAAQLPQRIYRRI